MPFQPPIPERKKTGKTTPGLQGLVEAEKMIQIAIMLPLTTLVGWLAGAWLDKRLHQSWIGFTGILVGGVAGLVYVILLALKAEKSAERQDGGKAPDESARPDQSRGKTE